MTRARHWMAVVIVLGMAPGAMAQSLGTHKWQLQPYCNIVSFAVTQNGGIFRIEGTDDQCGAPLRPRSSAWCF